MNDDNILGGALGQLGQTVKQGAKQVVKLPGEMAQEAGNQIEGIKPAASAPLSGASGEPKQWQSDEERVKFLKNLYGPAQPSVEPSVSAKTSASAPLSGASADKSADKPEEQKELLELRNKLHKETYYQPLVNPPKPKEERSAEKVENEKKQEMQELEQKEAKKPPPWAVIKEQNKAEVFRGASG